MAIRFPRGLVVVLLWSMGGLLGMAKEDTAYLAEKTQIYHYRMKGKIRLLFFWVGKDNVGGGTITLSKLSSSALSSQMKEIEVLFGSKPSRVPGRINRWGYGKERSRWEDADSPLQGTVLKETVFEGFMRQSKENSLSEVRKADGREKAEKRFWYAGTTSVVQPWQAYSEIREFSSTHDFDFSNATAVQCEYQKRLLEGPPDRQRRLANDRSGQGYGSPYGFLTAVQTLIDTIAKQAVREGWQKDLGDAAVTYVYNARPYQLLLKKTVFHETFGLPLEDGEKENFTKVVQAEFQTRRMSDGEDHNFAVWFPLEGSYRAVPIRIVDKPRWWVRIELNLVLNERAPGLPDERIASRETECD